MLYCINKLCWRQQRRSGSDSVRSGGCGDQAQNIHLSCAVGSVITYGSETWTMRKVDSDSIQSFHMQALRRILGIRWYDKVFNAVNERTKLLTSFIIWSHIDSSGHRGSMSKNENFSGNDFKEIASFNGCFYRLDITL